MARIFVYDDREFPEPDPDMSVDQVKATLSDFYGEIANGSDGQGSEEHTWPPRWDPPYDQAGSSWTG